MSYHSQALVLPNYPYPLWGLGAAASAPQVSTECLAWAQKNYDFTKFNLLRQTIEGYIKQAPFLPGTPDPRKPLTAADFQPIERAKYSNEQMSAYLSAAAAFVNNAYYWLDQLARSVNLPTVWFFFNGPETVVSATGGGCFVTPTINPILRSSPVPVNATSGAGYYQPFGFVRDHGAQFSTDSDLRADLQRYRTVAPQLPVDVVAQSGRYPIASWGFSSSVRGLADLWLRMRYSSRTTDIFPLPQRLRGAADAVTVQPVAALVAKEKSGAAASIGASFQWASFAGPQLSVYWVVQLLRHAASRDGFTTVMAAFQTWAQVLEVWAGHPCQNSAEAGNSLRAAAATIKTIGRTGMATGALGANPWVLVASVAVSAFGELLDAVGPAEGQFCPKTPFQHTYNKGVLKKLCGPPAPLRVKPPRDCNVAAAVTDVHDEERKKACPGFFIGGKCITLPTWLPGAAVAVAAAVTAAVVLKKVSKRKPNRRRTRRR